MSPKLLLGGAYLELVRASRMAAGITMICRVEGEGRRAAEGTAAVVLLLVVAVGVLAWATPIGRHLFDKGDPFMPSHAAGENRGGPNPALWGSVCRDQEEEEKGKEEEEEEEEDGGGSGVCRA
jgi:hypothetical protein